MGTPLPFHIIQTIAQNLQPHANRTTLAALRRVSQDAYTIATPILYRDILISDRGQDGLLDIELTWKRNERTVDTGNDENKPKLTFEGSVLDETFWKEFDVRIQESKDKGTFFRPEYASARQLCHLRLAKTIRVMALPHTPAWGPHPNEHFHRHQWNPIWDLQPNKAAIRDDSAGHYMVSEIRGYRIFPNLENLVLGHKLLSTPAPFPRTPTDPDRLDIHTSRGLWYYLIHFFQSASIKHVCFDLTDPLAIVCEPEGDGSISGVSNHENTDPDSIDPLNWGEWDNAWFFHRMLDYSQEVQSITVHHANTRYIMPLPRLCDVATTYQFDVYYDSQSLSKSVPPRIPVPQEVNLMIIRVLSDLDGEGFEGGFRIYTRYHPMDEASRSWQAGLDEESERRLLIYMEGTFRGGLGSEGEDLQEYVESYHYLKGEDFGVKCECCSEPL